MRDRRSVSTVPRRTSLILRVVVALVGTLALILPAGAANAQSPWSPPTVLSTDGAYSFNYDLASTASASVAIWNSAGASPNRAQVSRTVNQGVTWSTPQFLSPADGQAFEVAIHAFGDQHFTATWVDGDAELMASTSADAGLTWSSAQRVASGVHRFSGITSLPNSTLIVSWMDVDNKAFIATSTNAGATWQEPTDPPAVVTNTFFLQSCPNNELIAVWFANGGTSSKRSNDAGQTWTSAQSIASSGYPQQIAVTQGGRAALAWRDNANPTRIHVTLSDCDHASLWGASTPISSETESSSFADLTANGEGFIAAWGQEQPSGNSVIHASVLDGAGNSWSEPVPLSDPGTLAAYVTLAANELGTVVATWYTSYNYNPVQDTISFAVSQNSGASWSAPGEFFTPESSISTVSSLFVTQQQSIIALWAAGSPRYSLFSSSIVHSDTPTPIINPAELARTGSSSESQLGWLAAATLFTGAAATWGWLRARRRETPARR